MTKPFEMYLQEAIARQEREEAIRLARQAQAEQKSPLSLLDAEQIWELARNAVEGDVVDVRKTENESLSIVWIDSNENLIVDEYTH